jgi:hypothetical protein
MIGAIVSKGMAKLHEFDTVYGTQDMHDFWEIIMVDNANQEILNRSRE